MKGRISVKNLTPPGLPLSGEELSTHQILKNAQLAVPASPLTRGDRGGLGFIPYNKNLTALARENRNHPTAAESKLWYQLLRMRNLSAYKFTRQKPIANFIADFYCAELHLVIEVDGDSHAESITYDAKRAEFLSNIGITVVRYTNDDILNNLQGVYVDLLRRFAMLKGIS